MTHWRSSESGILRKTNVDDNLNELLVFGYSCKIFRDDEKALNIDQGKHLIPWMGDDSIKIDRYDGRAALPDLKYYEASREGYDTLRWLGLNESEKRLEELCDSERYYSLEINEEDEELYKEEAAKRKNTNEFAFQYDTTANSDVTEEKEGIPTVSEKDEDDEPYKPLPVLDVPVDISMPKTLKEYARIEKTALFVCRQGLQMEILIKAKQADNAQFSFLLSHDPLHKFYRHVLSALKNGRYQPQYEKKSEPPPEQQDGKESDYLHPSLQPAMSKQSDPPLFPYVPTPTLPYRPSADCAYSQLVNRIQGVGCNGTSDSAATASATDTREVVEQSPMSKLTLEQQYQQYYYVQYFYEHWRQHAMNSDQGAMYTGLPMEYSQLDVNMQTYINQLAWTHFMQQMQQTQSSTTSSSDGSSYAQIVSHVNKEVTNQYSVNVPQLQGMQSVPEKSEEPGKSDKSEVKKPLLSLAAYGSGSDTEPELSGTEPSAMSNTQKIDAEESDLSVEDQSVIDKMAEYVCKNGDQFEEIIKKKGDTRFGFLNSDHVFHKYYKSKLEQLKGIVEQPKIIFKKESQTAIRIEDQKADVYKKTEKSITPISFSIKKSKEDQPDIKSVLAMEDSSESETSTQPGGSSPSSVHIISSGTMASADMTMKNKTFHEQVESLNSIATSKRDCRICPDHRHRSSRKRKTRSSSRHRKVRSPRSSSRSSSPSVKKRKSRTRSHTRPSRLKSTISSNRNLDKENEGNIQNDRMENQLPTDDLILDLMDGEGEKTDGDIVQQKARQLERKRKAAMFLKLKSESSEKLDNSSPDKNEKESTTVEIEERYKRRSRKRSSSEKKYDSRNTSSSGSRSGLSPSKEWRRAKKRHTKSKGRGGSGKSDYDENRRKDKKKKHQKLKQKKTKKKKRRSRSITISRSRSRSKCSDSSIKSHISITDSP